jgi:cbb3-type cytochrome oxidase subunit 1
MKASSVSFQAAEVAALVGMAWGIHMAVSRDHSAMPAHAHLNLLGWVSLFLFGIFYRLHPALDTARSAAIQVWVWIGGTIVLTIGVAMIHAGNDRGDPIAGVGSLIVLLDMAYFGWLVLQRERGENIVRPSVAPGE